MNMVASQTSPRVSVIIPAYNHEKFVAQAIDSVLQQDFQDFEILITDDGSQDRTAEIIRGYTDPRILFFPFEENQGACAVANHALERVRGEYVAILSSDDVFMPEKLGIQVAFLDSRPDLGAVFTEPLFIDENGHPFEDPSHPYTDLFNQPNRSRFEWLNHFFYKENCLCHPTILIRSECYRTIGTLNPCFAQLPDFEFWVRLCQHYEIHILPEKLLQFRILPRHGNTSGPRPEVISRASWEHRQVLECFLKITPSEFKQVFPEYDGPGVTCRDEVAFALANLAIKGNVHHGFALDLFYDLKRRGVEAAKDFTPLDLIRLTGAWGNVYSKRIAELEHEVARIPELEKYNREIIEDCQRQEAKILSLEHQLQGLAERVKAIYNSTSWRVTRPLRRISQKLKGSEGGGSLETLPPAPDSGSAGISVGIVIQTGCDQELAEITLNSVWSQSYTDRQLIILYKGARDEAVFTVIDRLTIDRKNLVVIETGKDPQGESSALLEHAAGDYFLMLSAGDKLHETALERYMDLVHAEPEIQVLYPDEAGFDTAGNLYGKHFKPDWNPDLFLSTPYFENGTLVRTDLLRQTGGLDFSYGSSMVYDALLKCTEAVRPQRIRHIPEIFYMRHVSINYSQAAEERRDQDIRALAAAMERRQIRARVGAGDAPLVYRVRYDLPDDPPRVTIIILTRNFYSLLHQCVESILAKTDYPNYEILIVDNGSDQADALAYMDALKKEGKARLVRDDRPFNFSALSNLAAGRAGGSLIAMLNNDTEVINADWLTEMVCQALQPGVGAVGARLWYPDNTLQHGGVIFVKGLAGHAHRFLPYGEAGYFGRAVAVQNFSAVTAACMVMPRDLYLELGGMNEAELAVAYNDVDLCLRMTGAGYRIVWTPYAELYHHESASRGDDRHKKNRKRAIREYEYMMKNWGGRLDSDPAYNPNLPRDSENFLPEGFNLPVIDTNESRYLSSTDTYDVILLKQKLEKVEAELFALQHSKFWRATAPFRKAVEEVRSLVRRNPRLASFLKGVLLRVRRSPVPDAPEVGDDGRSVPSLDELKAAQKKTFEVELKQFLEAGDRLEIKKSDAPKVSILLILFNQAALTFRCLRSLAAETRVSFEVIVIDNNSQDETSAMIKQVSGITYVHNQENLNFLKAVNQAAEMACGDHILLLNNDAALLPGTLANAVFRLESDPKNGAVGGKIILVDGSLQEAGSIVWQDGSCLGYGRGQSPDAPQFQFLRTVDYCSGAFLLIRRNLFEELGRFDEDYAPAYYEESDFCLRLAEAGYRVIYDPCVEILHYEFGSSASTEQALALQRRNRKKLIEKHQETLAGKPAASSFEILNARDLTMYRGRVLFIEDRVPHDALGSGYPRCRTIVQSLTELGMFITFYPLLFPREGWDVTYNTLPRQVEVMLDHGKAELQRFLQEREGYYDYLLVSRPHNMEIVKYLHDKHPSLFKGMTIIYDAEAIFALREIRKQEVTREFASPRKYQKQLEDEMGLARIARNIITVSALEAGHFSRAGYDNVHVLSHSLAPKPTPAPFEEREGLFFVGSLEHDDSPNVDSLVWFVKKVLPELKKKCDIPITITAAGGAGSRQVLDLTSNDLLLTGRVEDLTPFFNTARVFIVPTRFAAGVPHKAHEAASHGVPMVTTSLIAEQLGWQDKKELLMADDPAEFASCVLNLYENQALWQQLRENALARIQKECSRERFVEQLEKLFCA